MTTAAPSQTSCVMTAILATLLAGCQAINEDIDFTAADPLAALTAPEATGRLDDSASISGFDRRAWDVVTVKVPVRQVQNRRTYVHNIDWPKQPEAWSPSYPDAAEALNARPDAATDVVHGLLDPVYAAGLLVWAPLDMAVLQHWPWQVVASPDEPYERQPDTGTSPLWSWIDFEPAPPQADEGSPPS